MYPLIDNSIETLEALCEDLHTRYLKALQGEMPAIVGVASTITLIQTIVHERHRFDKAEATAKALAHHATENATAEAKADDHIKNIVRQVITNHMRAGAVNSNLTAINAAATGAK